MKYYKYHGLGNDYLVLDPAETERLPRPEEIRLICHRNFGVGSDGILWGPLPSQKGTFGLRIFNPDGSEAEKSGNGLRIFSRYLFDRGRVGDRPFLIHTAGGKVQSLVHPGGRKVDVRMGRISFSSKDIPVKGPEREVINETLQLHGRSFRYCAATIGNPHCVIPLDDISEALAREIGPLAETDDRFPNRTNVQFMKVLDPHAVRIEIWERGAGYTLASGSSSCAAACVACKLGLCRSPVTVRMPGGELEITVSEDWTVDMSGPVTRVSEGVILDEAFEWTEKMQRENP
ncbi:diaminopimelate epimerase [bacterium]|nr:diaminopimelate epimerase [bacterium]